MVPADTVRRRAAGAFIHTLGGILALLPGLACFRVASGRVAIDRVAIEGAHDVSTSDIKDAIATAASPRFLGLFSGVVFDYEMYDPYVLERDLLRIERYYRARGYYEARARAARVVPSGEGHVAITIEVFEGEPVLVGETRVDGLTDLHIDDTASVLAALRAKLRSGRPFDEDRFEAAKQGIERALADAGHAYAKVSGEALVDLPNHVANVVYRIVPGNKAVLGPIRIDGLGSVPEAPVRRALDLDEGRPYSLSQIEAARRAALELGVFSSVEIEQDLGRPDAAVVPITVHVVPSKLRAVKLGVGAELDVIRTDGHLTTGWEDRNFLGGLRRLSIDDRPGLVLYPTRLPDFPKPVALLPENRARVELRQPGLFEARTAGIARLAFNIYPYAFPLPSQAEAQAKNDIGVPGYREVVTGLGADRTFGPIFASLFYDLQLSYPFTYGGQATSANSIVLSYVDLSTTLDLRNDPIRPTKGLFVGNDLQVAGGALGGDATDFRIQPEVRAYVPISRRVTFAVRATTGFVFPSQGEDPVLFDQLVYLRGFFSGGANSNRGYGFREIGARGAVAFFIPARQSAFVYCQQNPDDPLCQIPLGGLSLWEASTEVRLRLHGALGTDVFCDASDVSRGRAQIRLDYPHLSCGAGLRYDTPVGPFRFDFGYQIPGMQILDPNAPDSEKRLPGDSNWAISLGIGEAF
jgi:outer membrane protein insertion porin family/translocation and assembly module TamA